MKDQVKNTGNKVSAMVGQWAGVLSAVVFAGNVMAFDDTAYGDAFSNDWSSPASSFQNSYQKTDQGFHSLVQRFTKKRDRSEYVLQYDEIVRSFSSTDTDFGGMHFASQFSDREQHMGAGITFGRTTLFSNVGRGEDFSKVSSTYAGLDPYAYHGGVLIDYSYSGSGLNIALGNGKQIQAGYSEVRADRLQDRRASYVDFSTNRFYGRYTHVERAGETVAYGLDAGFRHGRVDVSYQELTSRKEVSTRRIRLNFNKDQQDRFWLDLSQHHNPVFDAHNDTRVMLSWQRQLGSKPDVVASSEDRYSEQSQSNFQSDGRNGFVRGVSLAAGAAGAALIASSGNPFQDDITLRRASQEDAAREVLNDINPTSILLNREFGGFVYRLPDGSFYYTAPYPGTAHSVRVLPFFVIVPPGATATAGYHTHAAFDPRFRSEEFSQADINVSEALSIDGYLATPAGRFWYYDHVADQRAELGGPGTIATN